MKLVLFRHAQKSVMPFEDPELSPHGFEQGDNILKLVLSEKLPAPTLLLVSPKRRTSQTFYKLSKEKNLQCRTLPELDQREIDETSQQFRGRVRKWIEDIELSNPPDSVCFACTHYDVIEEAMLLIPSDRDLSSFEFSHWSPTQFIEFHIENGLWKYIQKGDAK
jgi:phosphohistidine phosphatase SixA